MGGKPSKEMEMEPGNKVDDLEEGTIIATSEENNGSSAKDDIECKDKNNIKNVKAPELSEPDLIVKNKMKIDHFRRSGVFLLQWKNGKYEVSQAKLLIYYILWYIGAVGIFGIAYGLKEYFKPDDYIDDVNDLLEAAFVGIFIGALPAYGIYLLREYSTHLPQILMRARKFENTDFYKELQKPETERTGIYKQVEENSSLKMTELSYYEGFLEDDHNDEDDEVNIETEKSVKEQWWLVRYGPFIGMALSFATCIILILVGFFVDFSAILYSKTGESLKVLEKDLPSFIMTVLYPLKACTSIWFCIFFLEWQRKIYECLRHVLRSIKKATGGTEAHKTELSQIVPAVKEVQKAFILLNKKIFQKTIVIDFVLFIFLGVFCCWKILQDTAHLAYMIPLSNIFGHVYFVCKWSNDLMSEHSETIEVLNEMPNDDVENLRTELEKYPPQVMAFGGFSVNYSMMTAVIAFVLSVISITGMIWPDLHTHHNGNEDKVCYEYQDPHGEWNTTVCLEKHCYSYQIGGIGEWNNKLCIKEKISEELFSNGVLSLKL